MLADDLFHSRIRPKLIAEVGLSHDGSVAYAIALGKAAARAGADIVKYQVHYPGHESTLREPFRVQFSPIDNSRWDYWDRTSFNQQNWRLIKDAVEDEGKTFSASVFSRQALDTMLDLEVKTIKLGSGDTGNEELRESLKDFAGSLILSTGMSRWSEIEEAAAWLRSLGKLRDRVLLQCTSSYPTPLHEVGLNVMLRIRDCLGVSSGLSDHSVGLAASKAALILGAEFVEKHITFHKAAPGPDVVSAMTVEDLSHLSAFSQDVASLMRPIDKDEVTGRLNTLRHTFGRSLGLVRCFNVGEKPRYQEFCLRKPGGGLGWEQRRALVGKPLIMEYDTREVLTVAHFGMQD